MIKILTFPDEYTLIFTPSEGETQQERGFRNPNGAYVLFNEKNEKELTMEVIKDGVRSYWFGEGKKHFELIDKLSDIHDFLGVDYKETSASMTNWVIISEEDEKILRENFSGMYWRRIGSKTVLFRTQKLQMKKKFTNSSASLLRLLAFSGCEEGFSQLIDNGSPIIEDESQWEKVPLSYRVARYGTIAMIKKLKESHGIEMEYREAAILREALRNPNKEMFYFLSELMNLETKDAVLNLLFFHCLEDKDLDACESILRHSKSFLTFGNNRDAISQNWDAVVEFKRTNFIQKVWDKTLFSTSHLPIIKSLVEKHQWEEGVSWLNEQEVKIC